MCPRERQTAVAELGLMKNTLRWDKLVQVVDGLVLCNSRFKDLSENLHNCLGNYSYWGGGLYAFRSKPCYARVEYRCRACNINEYLPSLFLSQMATCHACNTTSRHKGMNRDFIAALAKTHSTPGSAGKHKTPQSTNRGTPKTPGKDKTPSHTPR